MAVPLGVHARTAHEIAKAINGAEFSIGGFTAVRSYAEWDESLEDLNVLHLDVVPSSLEHDIETRGDIKWIVGVDVGVRQRFGQDSQNTSTGRIAIEELDAIAYLFQEICEFFTTDRLVDFDSCVWSSTTVRTAFARMVLKENRQFQAIVRIIHEVEVVIP